MKFVSIYMLYHGQDTTQGQSRDSLNPEFSFSLIGLSGLTKKKTNYLPSYLLIFSSRRDVFIPFPTALVRSETQTVESRIWSRGVVSISLDDKKA